MRIIEIEDEEAKERPLTDHEREEMLAVKDELSGLMGKMKPKDRLKTSPAQVSHLVYLANLALHGTGNPALEKRQHNTPTIIFGGEAQHALAFETYGFTPHLLEPQDTIQPLNEAIAISDKQLTKENAKALIRKLAHHTRIQIHHITDPKIDNLEFELPGWKTKIIEYAVERHEGNQIHERVVTPDFGAHHLGPARWVVMQKIERLKEK